MASSDAPPPAFDAAAPPASNAAPDVKSDAKPEKAIIKPKRATTPMEKKPKSHSNPASHPTYVEMIVEAIISLKDRTGSSQHAIAKCIEAKHKAGLTANFKKILSIQLKRLSQSGQLVKVKNSYKLSDKLKKPVKPAGKTTTKPKSKKPAGISKPKAKTSKKVNTPKTAKTEKAKTPATTNHAKASKVDKPAAAEKKAPAPKKRSIKKALSLTPKKGVLKKVKSTKTATKSAKIKAPAASKKSLAKPPSAKNAKKSPK